MGRNKPVFGCARTRVWGVSLQEKGTVVPKSLGDGES